MQRKFSSSLIQFSREVWSEQPLLEDNSWLKNASLNAFIPVDIFIDFFKGFDVHIQTRNSRTHVHKLYDDVLVLFTLNCFIFDFYFEIYTQIQQKHI